MLRGETAIVSRLGLNAKSACRLEATERKGHVGPVEVSGADSAGVKRRSHHAEALCRGSHQATLCCLQPGLLGPRAQLPPGNWEGNGAGRWWVRSWSTAAGFSGHRT